MKRLPRSLLSGLQRLALPALLLVTGCNQHKVEFQDTSWHYLIGGPHLQEAVTVVIDPATLSLNVPIHSFTAGITNVWDARPGEMLRQVARVELPQMFTECHWTDTTPAAVPQGDAFVIELSIAHYTFKDFQASLTMHARVTRAGGRVVVDQDYAGIGPRQTEKMFLAGPFGMKSSVRQSSLAAFKIAFARLRSDLARASRTGAPAR